MDTQRSVVRCGERQRMHHSAYVPTPPACPNQARVRSGKSSRCSHRLAHTPLDPGTTRAQGL